MRIRQATRIKSDSYPHAGASLSLHRVAWFNHFVRWQVRVTRPDPWADFADLSTVATFRTEKDARKYYAEWALCLCVAPSLLPQATMD